MNKIPTDPESLIYPSPIVLVGANVDDKPNFLAVGACGVANAEPPMISVAIRHNRYTDRGIRQNMSFSVNLPSRDMIKETDYCGIVSGSEVNKVKVCQFRIFYGKLKNAPLIEQCPINIECKVIHILDLGSHSLVIGTVEESYTSDNCLTGGKPDINKIQPLAWIRQPSRQYHALGEVVAKAFSIGKELETRQ